jgi:FkbM family methyltransferase
MERAARRLPPSLIRRLGHWQFSGVVAQRLAARATRSIRSADVEIAHGEGAGLRFNAAGTNAGYALGTTEPLVQRMLAKHLDDGSVMYDLGASVGFFTVLAARMVGQSGHVYAFEPVLRNARALERNVEINGFRNVTVIPRAVSNRTGAARFETGLNPTAGRVVSAVEERESGNLTTVGVVALDDLLEQGSVLPPDFIKADIEGAEIEAVRGMQRTLERHRPIVLCEMHARNAEFTQIMGQLDYEVVPLEDFASVEEAPWGTHVVARPIAT